jgi:hypothetical protein
MGCGAPVLPVIGLAFVGLSSGTLKLVAGLSKVFAVVILSAMTFGVAYFGWTVSIHSETASRLSLISSPSGKTKKFRGRWRKERNTLSSPASLHPKNKQDTGFTLSKKRSSDDRE